MPIAYKHMQTAEPGRAGAANADAKQHKEKACDQSLICRVDVLSWFGVCVTVSVKGYVFKREVDQSDFSLL